MASIVLRCSIKSKRYRCHWRKASGIYRFRAFFARKFTNDSIDANHCFPLTGGIRTPFSQQFTKSKACSALFEKTGVLLIITQASDKRHFFCQQNPSVLLTSEFVLYIIALVSYRKLKGGSYIFNALVSNR